MPLDDDMKQVSKSLDRMAKILAGFLLKDDEGGDEGQSVKGEQRRKIKRLKQYGFENMEIAEMLGTTPNSVAVAVHSLMRRKHRKKKSRSG